jgi:hypothetical protein
VDEVCGTDEDVGDIMVAFEERLSDEDVLVDRVEPSDLWTRLELDLSLILLLELFVDEVFASCLALFSDLSLIIFVRRGRRGASAEEFGKSSDELAFDSLCILSLLHTRCTRFVSLPLARRRTDDFDEAADSCPLTIDFLFKLDAVDDDFDDGFA